MRGRARSQRPVTPADDLAARGWQVDGGMVLSDGSALTDLVGQSNLPLYLYNRRILRHRVGALREAFPAWVPCYAVKANPHRAIVSTLYESGCSLEVSSEGEFRIASAVASGPRIGVVGPGKTRALVEAAIDGNAGWLAAESERDLQLIAASLASRRARSVPLVRVNMRHKVTGAGETMAGQPSQFGIDEEAVASVIARVTSAPIAGLHLYAGSQFLDTEAIVNATAALFQTFWTLESAVGLDWEHLVCGLGIGVTPSLAACPAVEPKQLHSRLMRALGGDLAALESSSRVLELDVGRYLVADAGLLVTRVLDVKCSRGRTFVVVDSGMHSFLRPMTPWGEQHAVSVLGRATDEPTGVVTVVGPACLPGDVLATDVALPPVTTDDLLLVHSVGAYGLSMSPLGWGSFGATRELMVDDG